MIRRGQECRAHLRALAQAVRELGERSERQAANQVLGSRLPGLPQAHRANPKTDFKDVLETIEDASEAFGVDPDVRELGGIPGGPR